MCPSALKRDHHEDGLFIDTWLLCHTVRVAIDPNGYSSQNRDSSWPGAITSPVSNGHNGNTKSALSPLWRLKNHLNLPHIPTPYTPLSAPPQQPLPPTTNNSTSTKSSALWCILNLSGADCRRAGDSRDVAAKSSGKEWWSSCANSVFVQSQNSQRRESFQISIKEKILTTVTVGCEASVKLQIQRP